jgi:type III pantothenate kinase
MLLVIDVGNTETVFGLYEGDVLKTTWRLSSHVNRTADESWILLKMWCESHNIRSGGIKGVVISSVVPNLTSVFSDMASRHLKIDPLIVSAETDTGLTILYDSPRMVGADRICNAVGGITKFGPPLIVVDFGTATTFDVISEKNEYIGGLICLGLKGASHELHRVAAKLPKVDLVFPSKVVGRNTETSIQAGIMWGTAIMVDGLVDRIASELGYPSLKVVATGGMAVLIVSKSKRIQYIEPFLTLEGMRIIYQRVASKTAIQEG